MARPKGAKQLAEELWKAQKRWNGVPRCAICGEPIPEVREAYLGRKG